MLVRGAERVEGKSMASSSCSACRTVGLSRGSRRQQASSRLASAGGVSPRSSGRRPSDATAAASSARPYPISSTVWHAGLSLVQSEKGTVAVASSLTTTAQAYTSEAKLWGSLRRTSGAMYSSVPAMRRLWKPPDGLETPWRRLLRSPRAASSTSASSLMPMSVMTGRCLPWKSSTLAGLRSQCTTPSACRWSKPEPMFFAVHRTSPQLGRQPVSWISCARLLSASGITTRRSGGVCFAPSNDTTFGCSSFFSMSNSFRKRSRSALVRILYLLAATF
mmetsp:Transcript_18384/g.43961  ORF Transcript_18384/g.43961 Transcript_18384/m.43961 type:complete len:277 (-) Transcript_18384:229-1059(-)